MREYLTGALGDELRSLWGDKEWVAVADRLAAWLVEGCPWPPPGPPDALRWFQRRAWAAGYPVDDKRARKVLGGAIAKGGYIVPCIHCGLTLQIPPAINCAPCGNLENPSHYFHFVCKACRKARNGPRMRHLSPSLIEQPAPSGAPRLSNDTNPANESMRSATQGGTSATSTAEAIDAYRGASEGEGSNVESDTLGTVEAGPDCIRFADRDPDSTPAVVGGARDACPQRADGHAGGGAVGLDGTIGTEPGGVQSPPPLPATLRRENVE